HAGPVPGQVGQRARHPGPLAQHPGQPPSPPDPRAPRPEIIPPRRQAVPERHIPRPAPPLHSSHANPPTRAPPRPDSRESARPAPTLGVLIARRAGPGLGAWRVLPCSLAPPRPQFPAQKERAPALGVWGAMGSAGVALGPVAGGALVAAVGWRSIFLVNV